jgi:WD40 repeat protein
MHKEQTISRLLTKPLKRDYRQPGKCVTKLKGQDDVVMALATLPDGSLASGGLKKSIIKVWDVDNGQCLQTFQGHNQVISDLTVLTDGHLVSCSWDSTSKLWDINTGECLQSFTGHKEGYFVHSVIGLANEHFASASMDHTIKLWNVGNGKCLQTLNGHDSSVEILTVLTDGSLASGGLDGVIKIWDIKSGKCVRTIGGGHNSSIRGLQGLTSGHLVSGSSDKTIKVWDVDTGRCLKILKEHSRVNAFTLLTHATLAVGYNNFNIKLWDTSTWDCLQTIKAFSGSFNESGTIHSLATLADGRLANSDEKKMIKIWEFPKLEIEEESVKTFQPSTSILTHTIISEVEESKGLKEKKEVNLNALKLSIAISYQQLTFGEELGRGGFGVVYKGEYQFGQVAIKTLLHQELKNSLIEDFKKEASMMASLRSPFIVSLYGVCLEKPHYSIVMEYMANGSLSNLLQNEKPIEWKIRYQIGLDVGGGLAYLHNYQMVHCDLKSLNILLDINHRAKISDFGLSKVKLETSFSTVAGGSTRWMAPELFDEGAKSTKAADVFAYGLVLWELGARKFPFATTRNEAVPMLVCRGKREEITKDTPPSMAKLIAKCWNGRAESRPKIDEAVKTLQIEQTTYKF